MIQFVFRYHILMLCLTVLFSNLFMYSCRNVNVRKCSIIKDYRTPGEIMSFGVSPINYSDLDSMQFGNCPQYQSTRHATFSSQCHVDDINTMNRSMKIHI